MLTIFIVYKRAVWKRLPVFFLPVLTEKKLNFPKKSKKRFLKYIIVKINANLLIYMFFYEMTIISLNFKLNLCIWFYVLSSMILCVII